MDEHIQRSTRRALRGAAACLCAVLMFPVWGTAALAAERGPAAAPQAQMLVPVGHTVGIKLFARGVLVVGLSDGDTPAEACGLSRGDVILNCNGTAVTSSEQFQRLLQSGGEAQLRVQRNGRVQTLSARPEKNDDGVYALGAWIRDSMAGIGTMTFYDPASGEFGALGHGITDVDTAALMPFSSGSILPSTVKAVKRGAAGAAGELRGSFDLETELGTLWANTDRGVFGRLAAPDFAAGLGKAVPVARSGEVKTGRATILSNVTGDSVASYDVEITRLHPAWGDRRELLVTVTDPELLRTTGGIVQGMSGSPILQNGRLVGAVTHVLLSDPTRGYGILMETMLGAAAGGEKAG